MDEKKSYDYEIVERIALIAESQGQGTRTELNVVAWNGYPPRLELRLWYAGGSKPSKKAIPLPSIAAARLRDALVKLDLPKPGADYVSLARAEADVMEAEKRK